MTDILTTYTFKYALPNFFSALFVFGFVPLICKYIGLVKQSSMDDESEPLLNEDNFKISVEKVPNIPKN